MNFLKSYQRIVTTLQDFRESKACYSNLTNFLKPSRRAFITTKWSHRYFYSLSHSSNWNIRRFSTQNNDGKKIHQKHNFKEYITEALKQGKKDEHTEAVIAILTASEWTRESLEDPKNEQDLVADLKMRWLQYMEIGTMPRKLSHLNNEQIEGVSVAAITIASCLVEFSRNLCAFRLQRPIYSTQGFGFIFEYVSRPEFVDAVRDCEAYIQSLRAYSMGMHASFTRYFYIGGASGSGKTRMGYQIPQALISSGQHEVLYVFINGNYYGDLPESNSRGAGAHSFTTSVLLSSFLPNNSSTIKCSFLELMLKMSQECFSQDSNTTKVLYVHIDECQHAPKESQAILRTIRDFTCSGNLPLVIVPVLSGTSVLDIQDRDLVNVTGMKPICYSLGGIEDQDITSEFLRFMNIDQLFPHLGTIIKDMGGVPRLLQYLAEVLNTSWLNRDSFDLDFARYVMNQMRVKIKNQYPLKQWLSRFGDDEDVLKNFLVLAVSGVEFQPKFLLSDGVSIEKCAQSGLFSLLYNSNEKCRISLPFVVVQYLNSRLELCDPELLDPFNTKWSSIAGISLQSLWFRIKAFQLLGKSAVNISELRPGCLASAPTANISVDISSELPAIVNLKRRIESLNDVSVPTGTDGSKGNISISDGIRINRCFENQPVIDGLLVSSPSRFRLIIQAKTFKLFKNDGTPAIAFISLAQIKRIYQRISPFIKNDDPFTTFIEVFTNRSCNVRSIKLPPSTIIIHRENWHLAVGPVFSQRLRT